MTPAPPRIVLDSSILFSRVLHELFGRLALEAALFAIVWSDELLAETKRLLIERKPVTEPVAERWVIYLRDAFPQGRITLPDEHPVDLATLTSDPDDAHVCALVLASAPVTLITADEGFKTPTRSPPSRSGSPAPTSSSPRSVPSSPTSSSRSPNARHAPGATARSTSYSTPTSAPAPTASPTNCDASQRCERAATTKGRQPPSSAVTPDKRPQNREERGTGGAPLRRRNPLQITRTSDPTPHD
jgi:hypothetical protein